MERSRRSCNPTRGRSIRCANRGRRAGNSPTHRLHHAQRRPECFVSERAEHHDHAHLVSSSSSRSDRERTCRAQPASACSPEARSALPRRHTCRAARARRRRPRSRLVREAATMQRGEEEVARPVAGEHAAGAVAAVRRRCEPHHEHPGVGVPKPGTGRAQYSSSRNDARFSAVRPARAIPRAAGTRWHDEISRGAPTPTSPPRGRRATSTQMVGRPSDAPRSPGWSLSTRHRPYVGSPADADDVDRQRDRVVGTRPRRAGIRKALAADHDLEFAETEHAATPRARGPGGGRRLRRRRGARRRRHAQRGRHGLVGTSTLLAPLPRGSTNVYAQTIGVPTDPVDAALVLLQSLETHSTTRIGVAA